MKIPDPEILKQGSSSSLRYSALTAADFGDVECVGADSDQVSGHPCHYRIVLRGIISNTPLAGHQSLVWSSHFTAGYSHFSF